MVDPIFAKRGTYPPFVKAYRSQERNPIKELPVSAEDLSHPDAVIVTHLHIDHFDAEARAALPKNVPMFVQDSSDREKTLADGFTNVNILGSDTNFAGVDLIKTSAQHGYVNAEFLKHLGNVCGVVFRSELEKTLYLTGDTICNSDVRTAIKTYLPQIIIVNAGANTVNGEQLIMGKEDVYSVHLTAPEAKIIATHMEAENHWNLSRKELREFSEELGFSEQLLIPEDGEKIAMDRL